MDNAPDALTQLVDEFKRLPGIGAKTAQRLAFHLLQNASGDAQRLAEAITGLIENIRFCSVCRNVTDQDPCRICSSGTRDGSILCVVEDPADLASFDRGGSYRGVYHVLHGVLSPLRGVEPDDLTIDKLIARVREGAIKEVVIATNPTAEGSATAMFLAKLIKPLGVNVTRIARGVPVGGDIEYVDDATLSRAIEGRQQM
jgi:recombination protein RecR